jgi:hypothetical protein
VVSIDFQRRNLLAGPVPCLDLTTLTEVPGIAVDLCRVWSGRTEYGQAGTSPWLAATPWSPGQRERAKTR